MKKMVFEDYRSFENYYYIAKDGNIFNVERFEIEKKVLLDGLRKYQGYFFNMVDELYFAGIAKEVMFNFNVLPSASQLKDYEYLKSIISNNDLMHKSINALFFNYLVKGVPINYYFVFPNNKIIPVYEIIITLGRFNVLTDSMYYNGFSNLEKIMYAYLYLQKKYAYNPKAKDNDIISSELTKNEINQIGANSIFSFMLDYLGIPYDEVLSKRDNQDSYRSALLVKIDDRKYNIHGRYIIDIGEDLKLKRNFQNQDTFSLTSFCLSSNEYSIKEGTITYVPKLLSNKTIDVVSIDSAYNNICESLLENKTKYTYSMSRILKKE